MLQGVEEKRLRSHDGTPLCYYVAGKGPAIVMANGLGGPLQSFQHMIEQLAPDYSILTWDYRGTFKSGRPRDVRAVSLQDQVRDLELLLAAEGIEEALVIGWSMGVQVALEFYRHRPKSVSGLVLMCGVAGTIFKSLPMPASGWFGPRVLQLGKRTPRLVGFGAQRMTRWSGFVPLMQRLGLVARQFDGVEAFRQIAQDYAAVDVEVYCETMAHLGRHDAYGFLQDIQVPTLLVAGARDRMTPAAVAQMMHQKIPDARLCVIDEGTHYVPVEFPEQVHRELDQFLREVAGYEPASCRQSYA